jgi:lysophospholipase L1-like esterase
MLKRAGGRVFLAAAISVLASCVPQGQGVIILCAGDSLTQYGYPPYLRRMLANEGIRARVVNYGRSGNTSGEYRTFLQVKVNKERLAEERPDVILIQLGTNDVRADLDFTPTDVFRSNMKEIISVFRTFRSRTGKKPRIYLAAIPDIMPGKPSTYSAESARRVEAEINPAIRALAAEEKLPFVDNHTIFKGRPDLLPEVHPSPEGYRAMARNWRETLRPFH